MCSYNPAFDACIRALSKVAFAAGFEVAMKQEILGPQGIEELESFANRAEPAAHALSRELTNKLKDDEYALARHADHMRSMAANILLLRDGYVPALRVDRENLVMRLRALEVMANVYAHFQTIGLALR